MSEATSSLFQCVRETIAELHFRASLTNEFGQIEPPYTAPALLAMADDLQLALNVAGPHGWVINRCANGHRWASEDKSQHCPVCGTSTWTPEEAE